jgi:hypothetical protein
MNHAFHPPPKAGYLWWAGEIHRYIPQAEWPQAIERVPEQCREDVKVYLRGIIVRGRYAAKMKARR